MRKNTHGKQTKRPTVLERMERIDAFDVKDRERLTQMLRRSLADRSARVRSWAVDAVRKHDVKELEGQILELLGDKTDYVRYAAVECIGAFHEDEAIAATWLYPLLHDPNTLARVETLEALERIGDKAAVSLIEPMLQDDDYLVRAYAADTISELGGGKYLKAIQHALHVEVNDNAKAFMAQALFSLGDEEQFSSLLELLSSENYSARCASANALDDLELTLEQTQLALRAVSRAERKFLHRGDRTTMTNVKRRLRKQLLEKLASVSTVMH